MIEVLEEEEDLSKNAQGDTDTPFIEKKYFKEVFDKYKSVLKCEVELTSDDNLDKIVEDQDEIEKEENKFL